MLRVNGCLQDRVFCASFSSSKRSDCIHVRCSSQYLSLAVFCTLMFSDIQDTLRKVSALLAEESSVSVLVVCGTGYIMPEARDFLGIQEPR